MTEPEIEWEIRDHEKVVRGLKKDDSPLIKGYQIFHNYVTAHGTRRSNASRQGRN
ncbi:MAG: hypothetical protein WAN47_07865 [Nitrosotalea sp.]